MEEAAAKYPGGTFLSEIVDAVFSEPPSTSNKRKMDEMSSAEGGVETASRQTEAEMEEAYGSSELKHEGWQLGSDAHPSLSHKVRFVDPSEVGESVARPELLLWEEGRVYAYLPANQADDDPALFKVTYIVDYEEQTCGFHDLEEDELRAAEQIIADTWLYKQACM